MTSIIGIVNYNNSSFSDGGTFFSIERAVVQIQKMFKDGADIIDIGATATSYGAHIISQEEEWKNLEPLLLRCKISDNIDITKISIDTFHDVTAAKAIAMGITMINDVSGGNGIENAMHLNKLNFHNLKDHHSKEKNNLSNLNELDNHSDANTDANTNKMWKVIANNPHVKYIMMFSLILPANRDIRVAHSNDILQWGKMQINKCINAGVQKQQIIFDPGIGFVTTPDQSIEVIKDITIYNELEVAICIGHSRKSFFLSINDCIKPQDRDVETLTASLHLYSQNVDYIRVHNVEWHKRAFKLWDKLHK